MARELAVAWIARHRRKEWDRLCDEYGRRISRFQTFREIPVRSRSERDPRTQLKVEGEQLLAALPDPCWIVALDRRGPAMSSTSFAASLQGTVEQWPHAIVFVLGSDLGLDAGVLEAARQRLSLGKMTLPHELARLVLYEQLYRALTIQAGISYHRVPLT